MNYYYYYYYYYCAVAVCVLCECRCLMSHMTVAAAVATDRRYITLENYL